MNDVAAALASPWVAGVLLLSVRWAAVLSMTPVLHAFPVPAVIRFALIVGLSCAMALPLAGELRPAADNLGHLAAAALREAAIGATLGLGILMAFAGFALAGRLLDTQIGFAIGQIFDPLTRSQVPVLTSTFSVLGVLLFFLVDGHHALMRGVAYSVTAFPVGQPWSIESVAHPVLRQAGGLFTLGMALAAPVVLGLLLLELGLGVIARNLPQINMFVMGIPAKIIAGLLLLSLWIGGMGGTSLRLYAEIVRTWTGMFQSVAAPAEGRR